MKDQYIEQAEKFLQDTKTKLTIKFDHYGKHFVDDNQSRNIYKCVLKNADGQYTIKFGDSIQSTRQGEKPSAYDVLSCLTKYDHGTFGDFCDDFGLDKLDASSKKIYRGCKKEYNGLNRLFTEKQMELLRDIQ